MWDGDVQLKEIKNCSFSFAALRSLVPNSKASSITTSEPFHFSNFPMTNSSIPSSSFVLFDVIIFMYENTEDSHLHNIMKMISFRYYFHCCVFGCTTERRQNDTKYTQIPEQSSLGYVEIWKKDIQRIFFINVLMFVSLETWNFTCNWKRFYQSKNKFFSWSWKNIIYENEKVLRKSFIASTFYLDECWMRYIFYFVAVFSRAEL